MSNRETSPYAGLIDLTRSKTVWPREILARRVVWEFLLKPLFMLLPERASGLRIALLRLAGARIGHSCLVGPRVRILMPWNLTVGDCSAIGREVEILNFAQVTIGTMTVISQYVFLCTGSHDYTHPHFPLTYEPINVGSECWIAASAFVGPGIRIGQGTVVGARSVVTRDLPEWMVCYGHPCRPAKPRQVRMPEVQS